MAHNANIGCKEFRDELEARVLAKLATAGKTKRPSEKVFSSDSTVIVANTSPFISAKEADAAEMNINWFSSNQADKQRACRVAFAALELQYYLRKITHSARGFNIVAKKPKTKSALILELDESSTNTDGSFEIEEAGGDYLFRGMSIQGCLYAVYDYLQQLGCNFLRPGKENEYVPLLRKLPVPKPSRQKPSFAVRRLHGWRKNHATPQLLDWIGKAKINLWGGDNLVAGMRKRGILLSSGMHDVLSAVGLDHDFCICNDQHRNKLLNGLIEAYNRGPWKDADVCEYIGADWGKRCACDTCKAAGTASDIEIRICHEIRSALHQAYLDGRLDRDMPVFGYAYFDSEEPPQKPMPEGFDCNNVAMELWSMRCWEHFLDETACSEDFPIISTMNDFLGKKVDLPSNTKIAGRVEGWKKQDAHFTGQFGFGYYFSNAGNYWTPLLQMAVICHELPYLHSIGCRRLGYMHIQPGNWGPQAVTNMLYSRLGWDVSADTVELLARYFIDSYGTASPQLARAYFDLERAAANTFTIRRFFIKQISSSNTFAQIDKHSHISCEAESGKEVLSTARMSEFADKALAAAAKLAKGNKGFIMADLPWFEYTAMTISLYYLTMKALSLKEAGNTKAAGNLLRKTDAIIKKLKSLDLEICLPEKNRVDCAEASGILNIIEALAKALDIELSAAQTKIRVQTSIEPVPAQFVDAGKINPTRWNPDTAWKVIDDADEIGLNLQELIVTDVKHQGIVAQRINGEMILAAVGDDRTSPIVRLLDWEIRNGASVVCFTGSGKLLWKHSYRIPDGRVNNGPWPAFIDTTGKGDWAVSIFTIEETNEKKRKGCLHLYDAISGKVIWQRAIPPAEYPGGNGSCVTGDLDGDGRIEIVYGLCNCVMSVDAQTGKVNWVYDDRIKICHGRLALCDVNDDGRLEIVVASEYGDNPTHGNDRSSIIALNSAGHIVYKMRNIQGDLGSTQIVVTDVDNDGRPEIIHGSENLCFHEPRHMGQLFVRERWLIDKLDSVSAGGVRFAVGDADGDGFPEAVAVTNYRDGGPYVKPEIYSVRLLDGRIMWKRPISRVWLDGDAIMADVDGDGKLEIIVTAFYPSGYMQAPGTQTWADLYILKGDGRIVYKKTFMDAVMSPITVDIDGDGKVEIVVPCYDGKIYVLKTPARACKADWPLVCQNACRTGVYPNTKTMARHPVK